MTDQSIEAYVAQQGKYTWRRRLIRGLIRQIGFRLLAKVDITGSENIPDNGPCILMMNHISALDPIACLGAVTNRFVVPMTKIENLKIPVLGTMIRWWGAYSVDRDSVDRKALLNSIELVKSGQMILIAPEGTRHPEGLSVPKDGMTYVATKSGAVILPTTISGKVDYVRRWKQLRRAQVRVNFGRPFRFLTDGKARIPRDILAMMTQEAMYQLALAQPDPDLRGYYSDLNKATTNHIEFVNPAAP
jgi:1-acyl-sn-glycerol-3-phosphate acyltransferase